MGLADNAARKATASTPTQARNAIAADKKASTTPVVAPKSTTSILSTAKPAQNATQAKAVANANSILASQSNPGNLKYIPSYASSSSKTTTQVTASNKAITQARTVASSSASGVAIPSYANPNGSSFQRANEINQAVTATSRPSTTSANTTTPVSTRSTNTSASNGAGNPRVDDGGGMGGGSTTTDSGGSSSSESSSDGGGGGSDVGSVPYGPAQEEVSIPIPPIKTATPDIVLFNDEAVPSEIITDLLFENIGGQELLTISRLDTVNGEDVKYQPIKNLNIIQQEFNPNNLLKLQQTSETVFNNFPIKLISKIPNVGNGENGSNIYRDQITGDIVIEFVNLAGDEQVDVQIATSGTIYEAGI